VAAQVTSPGHSIYGSVDAIRALNEVAPMAGFHTLQHTQRKTLTERTYKPLLRQPS
jgi:hypothetical protein